MVIVFLNPNSCGGTAMIKWEKVKDLLKDDYIVYALKENQEEPEIDKFYKNGFKYFIAAGGDGTVNCILNKIINSLPADQLKDVKLGAIGLGSSNDFHKPYEKCKAIDNIPFRIDFNKAEPRDVGCVSYRDNGNENRKYFLINASVGLTAEANNFFNNPDKILTFLKRKSTSVSIMYSVLKTILLYKNFPYKISLCDDSEFDSELSNLAIVKNPFFSGGLRYSSDADYSSGYFDAFLCEGMSFFDIIQLLKKLSNGKFDQVKKKRHWKTRELNIHSKRNFYIEYDGEILITDNAGFSILPKLLKVC